MEYKTGDKLYIVTTRFGAIELTMNAAGLWIDVLGMVYALRDQDGDSFDPVNRCGIRPIIMPVHTPLEDACMVHDFMHSSGVYQHFHTMQEANREMLRLMKISAAGHWSRVLARPFYWITQAAINFLPWKGKRI